jgi:hypothetical protein
MSDQLTAILNEVDHDEPPTLDARVIQWLDHVVPEKCPNPSDTKREIWMRAGERRLVVRLKAILERQLEPD